MQTVRHIIFVDCGLHEIRNMLIIMKRNQSDLYSSFGGVSGGMLKICNHDEKTKLYSNLFTIRSTNQHWSLWKPNKTIHLICFTAQDRVLKCSFIIIRHLIFLSWFRIITSLLVVHLTPTVTETMDLSPFIVSSSCIQTIQITLKWTGF